MNSVVLEDESLSDGLQSEKRVLPLEAKVALSRMLAAAGVRRLQVGSFVHPKAVPRMADTDEFVRIVQNEQTGIDLDALCPVVDRDETLLARPLPGRMKRVVKFPKEGCL